MSVSPTQKLIKQLENQQGYKELNKPSTNKIQLTFIEQSPNNSRILILSSNLCNIYEDRPYPDS